VKRVVIYTALAALVGLTAGTANAQSSEVTEERQMTLPEGRAFVQAFFEMSMSTDAVFKPFSIAPDLWYGVNDALTVGLVHSGRAATGFLGGAGEGLCLAGTENNCAKVYNSVGVDLRYHFYRSGDITAAADGGLFARSIDPFALALKVGMIGRWQGGSLAVELAPSLFVGLTERGDDDMIVVETVANKEVFNLPITAIFAMSPQLGLALQTGVSTPFEAIGDSYLIQLAAGVQYMVSNQLFADLTFAFPQIAGGPDGTGTDARTLTLGFGYAL
jgi:hypothetical protein